MGERLVNLQPRWIKPAPTLTSGMTFLCPCCRKQRIAVFFKDWCPLGTVQESTDEPRWSRTGDTFENITISPSVDMSRYGHWHGHIQNGEVTNA